MAALVQIAPHLRAVFAAHVLFQLVDRCHLRRGDVIERDGLGGVDSRDSLLVANQIQGFFLGGGLGCDGSFGFERRGLGADGASDYRSA